MKKLRLLFMQLSVLSGCFYVTAVIASNNPYVSPSNQMQEYVAVNENGCMFTSLTANFLPCYDQGTSDPGDDTFIADFTMKFNDEIPTTGDIELTVRGQTFSTSVVGLGNQFQFLSIPLQADGQPVEATVRFTAEPDCSLTNIVGTAPEPCSCAFTSLTANFLPCFDNGTPDPNDDTFIADFTMKFNDEIPTTGNIELTVRGQTFSTSVVGLSNQFQFLSIPLRADGLDVIATARFTDAPNCSITNNVGTAPKACSSCRIDYLAAHFLPCYDNGTSDPSDDTFIADFTTTFSEPPTTGDLELMVRGQTFSTSVAGLSNQFQFLSLHLQADGQPVEAAMRFTAEPPECTFTNIVGIAPAPCSCSADAGQNKTLCTTKATNVPLTGASFGGIATMASWRIISEPEVGAGSLSSTLPTAHPDEVTFSATQLGTYVLQLTTDEALIPGSSSNTCTAGNDTITIEVVNVDCGTFPWRGND